MNERETRDDRERLQKNKPTIDSAELIACDRQHQMDNKGRPPIQPNVQGAQKKSELYFTYSYNLISCRPDRLCFL